MTARQERDQDFADALLADDGFGQLALEPGGELGHPFHRRLHLHEWRECTTAAV